MQLYSRQFEIFGLTAYDIHVYIPCASLQRKFHLFLFHLTKTQTTIFSIPHS